MTLYEIGENYRDLAEMVEREEVTAEEVADTFAAIQDAAGVKIDSIAEIYRNKKATIDAIEAEIDRLTTLKKRQKTATERLENLVYMYLSITGKKRENGDKFSVSLRKNPARVNIVDEAAIPQEFVKEKVMTSIDRVRIKNALKAGETVAGATLVQDERAVIE